MRYLTVIFLVFLLSACARPVGDFGRADTDFVHDEIMPPVGWLRARIFGEPTSFLNRTDEENEMHDRAWRFIIAPHAHAWFINVVNEWQRTRLLPPVDHLISPELYYLHLRTHRYASSRTRYNAVAQDIKADDAMMPGVFEVICKVREIDRRRALAVTSFVEAGKMSHHEVAQRKAENEVFIAWFVRTARYRYQSYSIALKRLLVETPHEEAREIDALLSELAINVERAERHAFCGTNGYAGNPQNFTLPSRMSSQPFTPEPVYRK